MQKAADSANGLNDWTLFSTQDLAQGKHLNQQLVEEQTIFQSIMETSSSHGSYRAASMLREFEQASDVDFAIFY